MKAKHLLLILTIAIIVGVLLIAIGLHFEFKIPFTGKLFGVSFLVLVAVTIISAFLGKLGIYPTRYGPPPKNLYPFVKK